MDRTITPTMLLNGNAYVDQYARRVYPNAYPNKVLGLVGIGEGSTGGPFDTTSGTASFAVGEAGALTAASLALVGLGPIGAIVAVGTQIIAMIVKQFQGCGQTCVLTSQAADQVESAIKQMFNSYMTGGHTQSEQAAFLQQFDALWAKLTQYCGGGSFGQAGVNCVQDRQPSACKWKSSPFGWVQQENKWVFVPSGPNGSGNSCWNWFYYRDAVVQDPTVVPDTTAVTQAAQGVQSILDSLLGTSTTGVSMSGLLLPVALIVGAAFLFR